MAVSDLLSGAGGAQGLEQLLTRRLYEAQLAEQIRSNQSRESLEARSIEEAAALRRAQQEESMRRNREIEEDRYRQQAKEVSEQLPAGSELGLQSPEARTILRGGLASQLTKLPGHLASTSTIGAMTMPGGPQPVRSASFKTVEPAKSERYRKEPTALQSERQIDNLRSLVGMENLEQQRRESNDFRQQMIDLTRAFGFYHPINYVGPKGENLTSLVRPGGDPIAFPSQPPGTIKLKLGELKATNDQINELLRLGDKTQWSGVGSVGGFLTGGRAPGAVQSFGATQFGKGTKEDEFLRSGINGLKTAIGHEEFGSAFTSTERQQLLSYVPTINMHPSAIKARLQKLQWNISRRYQHLSQGGTLENAPALAFEDQGSGPAPVGQAPPAPAGWKYIPKPGGGWTAVPEQ